MWPLWYVNVFAELPMYKVFLALGRFPLVDVAGAAPFRVTAKSFTA
jgi:hypothetical protein